MSFVPGPLNSPSRERVVQDPRSERRGRKRRVQENKGKRGRRGKGEDVSGGVANALVNAAFIDRVEEVINDNFINPKPLTTLNDHGAVENPPADGPAPDRKSPETIDTDIEETDVSPSGSPKGLRKGAAYDGDSSQDQD